jgi:hypothetical protein
VSSFLHGILGVGHQALRAMTQFIFTHVMELILFLLCIYVAITAPSQPSLSTGHLVPQHLNYGQIGISGEMLYIGLRHMT